MADQQHLTYSDADKLPREAVERMWRAVEAIADADPNARPGHVAYLSKTAMHEIAKDALPNITTPIIRAALSKAHPTQGDE